MTEKPGFEDAFRRQASFEPASDGLDRLQAALSLDVAEAFGLLANDVRIVFEMQNPLLRVQARQKNVPLPQQHDPEDSLPFFNDAGRDAGIPFVARLALVDLR